MIKVIGIEEAAIDWGMLDEYKPHEAIPYFCSVQTEAGDRFEGCIIWRVSDSNGNRVWRMDEVEAEKETIDMTGAAIEYPNGNVQMIAED